MAKGTTKLVGEVEERVEVEQQKEEPIDKKDPIAVMNRGRRSYILDPKSVLQGGELSPDKKSIYLNAGQTVTLTKKSAEYHLKMFPAELIRIKK